MEKFSSVVPDPLLTPGLEHLPQGRFGHRRFLVERLSLELLHLNQEISSRALTSGAAVPASGTEAEALPAANLDLDDEETPLE